jgi:CBS-domain-containing membrane protein
MTSRVGDVMTRDLTTVGPEWTLPDIARLMRDENLGAIPVVEEDELIGIVTDRDLVTRGIADDLTAASGRRARDVMSGNLLYCFEDQSVEEALQNMGERQVRRLPVVDRDKRLVGMVSLSELSRSASTNFAFAAHRRMSRAGLH